MESNFYLQKVERAQELIEESLSNPPSLSALAKQLHLSPFYFHRIFAAAMGCTLKQYISSRRINKAVQLVQGTNLALTDIGYTLGFPDQAAFSRAFRAETGVPPSRLRRGESVLEPRPMAKPVLRSFKNVKGDVVSDFSLDNFPPVEIRGVAFEVDLADRSYPDQIRRRAQQVHAAVPQASTLPSYMIYSGCSPGSSVFRALFGVPVYFEADLDNLFSVRLPEIFCSRLRYRGDLLEIGQVFVADFARFLKIVRVDRDAESIELVQVFEPGDLSMENYEIWVPIVKTQQD